MEQFEDAYSAIRTLTPENPLCVFRPKALERAAAFFLGKFKGTVLYAIKTNPEPYVLRHLYAQGVQHFDVASLAEVELARSLFGNEASLYFMHTVKSRRAIREAYHTHGVRHFALDSEDELQKILSETGHAKNLSLYVRLSIPNTYAELNLADKFGVNAVDAVPLLRKVRPHAEKLGVCFHVGSQCMHPDAYRIALRMVKKSIQRSGVEVDMLDVGGGFPSIYPGMIPPPIQSYLDTIHDEFSAIVKNKPMRLMCEPGRALVAESGAVIVRVELRKKEMLYINDGTYGTLFDAGIPHFIFPVRLLRNGEEVSNSTLPYSLFGPTCDTLDFMKGPFYLPDDVREGDYIEIGQLGAYGKTFNTGFNGFSMEKYVAIVNDDPLMSVYEGVPKVAGSFEIIAA